MLFFNKGLNVTVTTCEIFSVYPNALNERIWFKKFWNGDKIFLKLIDHVFAISIKFSK